MPPAARQLPYLRRQRGPRRPAGRAARDARRYEAAKRFVDVLLAGVLLVVLLSLFVLVAVAIKLKSPGPVLFRQVRCGRHCRRFVVLKFRSMRPGASLEDHRRYIGELRPKRWRTRPA